MPAHLAHSFLSAAPNLQTLLQQAQKLLVLQKAWTEVAPKPLAAVSRVGAVRLKTLIVYANNGAVAGKLRQFVPSLLEKIQNRGIEITAIRVDVQVESPLPGKKPKTLTVSHNALSSLEKLEQSLVDSPLKNALHTLIQRHSDAIKD
ncbi:MAG: DUF721 domain-containing protein [Gammaproteobacteria bacterium]|nr:DUF721 domain-containing protein [Gammaproteobacteria bacterium]MBU1978732.1 DUF721 domain-containing protein [Gammaproteobacteria bacterium]